MLRHFALNVFLSPPEPPEPPTLRDVRQTSNAAPEVPRSGRGDVPMILIPRCSHQNSWYLWMFIPFKIKKMMGNLFRYFLDPNMDLGEGAEPLGLSSLGTI